MKRLLTYLSAIIIMMMVPIGAQAWSNIQMIADFSGSEQTYGASGVNGNNATIIVDASSLTHGNSYNFKIKASNDGGTYWGWNNTFDMTSNSKVTDIYASDNSDYFKIKHDSKYLKYKFTFNYTDQSDNGKWKWKITVEGITATLTIGGTDITGTNSGSNYNFTIPAASYTAGSAMTFTLKTETGGTATYYTGNFTGTHTGDAFNYTTSTSPVTMSYSVPSDATGNITVSLLTRSNEVVFAYTPSGGGSSTGYYLVGDLNCFGRPYTDTSWNTQNWTTYGAVNKVMQFHYNGDGTYSLRIPASRPSSDDSTWDKPVNEKGSGTSQFVIAPEAAFSGIEYSGDLFSVSNWNNWSGLTLDWSQVLRPQDNMSLDNAAISNGTMAASGSSNWSVYNNGGSYTITINPTAGKFSVTNDNTTHVMYVITKQDGYWRNSYLTDVTSDQNTAYNHRHGDNASTGELSEFPNEDGATVYIAHNWHEQGSNKNFTTNQHLNIFGAWNSNGDLAPVTWIAAKSGASAKSIFPTAGNYSTNIDPTTGRTDGVDGKTQYSSVISSGNDPSTGNITGKKGDEALISPDATLSPGTTTWDSYTLNEAKTLTVTLSNATKYAYVIGANSSVTLDESSTKTDGSFTLTYDGTKVTDGFGNVVTGNTVYVKIQGQDASNNKGTIHTYQYTFNEPGVTTLDFNPKSGFFINKAVITVTNGTAPYTYTIKDANDKVLSTGTSSSATFTISTPGYLTVEDSNSGTKTSDEAFDFTYSTSENYANYYNNGTTAQSVAQEGGKDATNIFLKKAEYKNMRIYAWDYTYDQKLQAYQRGETTDIDEAIAALNSPHITKSSLNTYDNDGNEGQGNKTWNQTAPGYAERDPHVMLTEPYPGTLMSDSRTIEIDGETYYYLTLPLSRLHDPTYDVGIIMTRNDENPANMSQNADLYKTADIEIKGNSSFIYSSSEETRFATPTGDNVVFYTNPNNWSSVKVYMWNGSGGEGNRNAEWSDAPAMTQSGSVYYYVPTQKWENVIFYDGGNDSNKTPDMGYGGGRYYYDNANKKKTTYVNKFYDISELVETNGNIIFFDKANSTGASSWSQVYCYAWKDGNDSQRNADWPGVLMADYGNGMYIEEVDPNRYDRIKFNNGSGGSADKTPNISDFGSGKYVYTYDGTSVNKTEKTVDQDGYNTYINKSSKYTVEVQNHPNGDDYLRAMPSDKTVLLDPTWGGVITPKQVGDEETSVDNWNGVKGDVTGYRKFVKQDLTQTIYGLDNSKTYTVQAIVRVWSNEGAKVSLKVGDGEAVTSKNYGASSISHVNKNGRVDEKYTQGHDLDDPYFIHYDPAGLQGFGWQKIEATGKPTAAGNLVVTLTFDKGTSVQYDLADVILLEDANTAGHYWTKLPTDETSAAAIKAGEINMTNRATYNAFSFFDRDNGNPNAIIKASNRTVIGLNSGIAYVQNSSNENVLDNVDHRQSRNTISQNSDGTWSGRYLYIYDESSDWSDCNAYGATVNFSMIGAKYDRQFTANQHSTMFLPFAVTTEQLKTAGFKELQMVDVDNVTSAKIPLITWDLTKEPLTDKEYTTTAGQGYIVIAGGAGASLSSFIKPTDGVDVQAANSALAKKTEAKGLVGAYVYSLRYQTEDAGGTTYMNYSYLNDKFRALATAAQGGAEIKPFRATFAVPKAVVGEARMLSTFNIDADEVFTPTGVDKLGVEEQLSGNIYTLDGRLVSTNGKLSELSRGIYVRGGRKIVVK